MPGVYAVKTSMNNFQSLMILSPVNIADKLLSCQIGRQNNVHTDGTYCIYHQKAIQSSVLEVIK
jgi:hypothetical protein